MTVNEVRKALSAVLDTHGPEAGSWPVAAEGFTKLEDVVAVDVEDHTKVVEKDGKKKEIPVKVVVLT